MQRANSQTAMDMMRPTPYYAAILLWMHVVGATVLPPTNVTLLHCHNLRNTLSWAYDESVQGVRFEVLIESTKRKAETRLADSPNMSIDLSEFSDPYNDYAVTVTAVKDGNKSIEVPEDGIQYSYNRNSPTPIKCSLDLPSVTVITLEENHLQFSFTHPGVLYPTSWKTRKKRSLESADDLPDFHYHIEVLKLKESHKDHCREKECQGRLQVSGSEKSYCLNISGEMNRMSVRATKKYCSEPLKPAGTNPLSYIIPIVLVLVGVVFIGSMVYVKKTRSSTRGPSALDYNGRGIYQRNTAIPETSACDVVTVEPASPEPLLSPDQNTSNHSNTFSDDMRLPLGVRDRENENEEAAAGAQEEPADGYTQGTCLDGDEDEEKEEAEEEEEEDEEPPSAYERRLTPVRAE